jgi:hypothetical protein
MIVHRGRNLVCSPVYPIQKRRIGQLDYWQGTTPMRAKQQESDKRMAK